MADHTAFGIATKSKKFIDYNLSLKEKKLLRILAEQVAELASHPREAERRQLWYDSDTHYNKGIGEFHDGYVPVPR